jgi:hypothetical protein
MDKKKVKEIDDKLNDKLENEFNQIDWYLQKIKCVKEMAEELAYKIQEELEEVKNE